MQIFRSQRGVALPLAIVAAVLVAIIASIVLNVSGFRFRRTSAQARHGEGFYAAEAGVQVAFIKLREQITPFNTDPGTWSVLTGNENPPSDAQFTGMPFKDDTLDLGTSSPDINKFRVIRTSTGPDKFRIEVLAEY